MPTLLADPEAMRRACDAARASGQRVGFVPTMGALHDGHLALVRAARQHAQRSGGSKTTAGFCCVSIFVNPTQFGPNEDYARYPRDLAGDTAKLASAGCDAVFAPEPGAMYSRGERTRVRVGTLAETLCGPFRPGHFEGVATVVTKLFGIVGPCVAVFGKKDYQQLAVVRRLVRDLFLPVEIVGHPIVREPDGLAMSSRNAYLSPAERERALTLSKGLSDAAQLFRGGERSAGALRRAVRARVDGAADAVDYVDTADPESLRVVPEGEAVAERALLALACRIGRTRLIDNVVLGEDGPPIPP